MFYNNSTTYMLGSIMGARVGNAIGNAIFGNKGNSFMNYALFGMMTGFGAYSSHNYTNRLLSAFYDPSPAGSFNMARYSIAEDIGHYFMGGFSGGYDSTMGLPFNPTGMSGSVTGRINEAFEAYNLERTNYISSFSNRFDYLDGIKLGSTGTVGSGVTDNFAWFKNLVLPPVPEIGSGGGVGGAGSTTNSDAQKLQAKKNLIEKYAAYKENPEIKTQMAQLINGLDAKEACKKLDEYIKTFSDFNEFAETLCKDNFNTKITTGKGISDGWVTKIANLTVGGDAKVDTSKITKDNILDVLGTYISNEKFGQLGKSGMWNPLLKNEANFNAISQKLYNKADDLIKKDPGNKATIESAVSKLKGANDTNKANYCYELFACLRKIEADTYAKQFSETFGLPDDMASSISNPAVKNYNDEKEAWNKSPTVQTEA